MSDDQSRSSAFSDMWVDPEDDPRDTGTETTDERSNVLEYLRAYRLTLGMKCEGLTPEQLATCSVPPSTMSLLGLVRHLAKVEQAWFQLRISAEDAPRLYWSEADRDAAFSGAVGTQECVDDAFATWQAQIANAEQVLDGETDMGRVYTYGNGESAALRDILVHMVEEYARHCGHADLLRECIDGRTGQ